MKLLCPQFEGAGKRPKAAEMVGRPEPIEPVLEFDPLKIVPPEIWRRVNQLLQMDKSSRPPEIFPLLRLAEFDSELKGRVQQDPDFADQIQSEIYNVGKYANHGDKDISVNAELARYSSLFPEVLSGLDDDLFPFPHDLQKSLDSFTEYRGSEYFTGELAQSMAALLQLFPDRKDLVLEKLESIHYWEKTIEETREISRLPGDVVDILPAFLAHLAIIFPDKVEEILGVIQPRWALLQERMEAWGRYIDHEFDSPDVMERPHSATVARYVDNIFGMSILAERSRKRKMRAPQQLPDRLVA